METIDTMVRNAKTLSEANIDWSPTAGMFWFTGMVIIMAVTGIAAAIQEARSAR